MGLKKRKYTHTSLVQTWEAPHLNSLPYTIPCVNTYNCVYESAHKFWS